MLRAGCEPRCPGCAHRELSREESESQKQSWLKKALAPWADRIQPVRSLSDDQRWGYRDKTVLFARLGASGWEFGMRIPLRTSEASWGDFELIPIPGCPVHTSRVRSSLEALSQIVPSGLPLAFAAVSGAIVTLVFKQAVPTEEEIRDLRAHLEVHSTPLKKAGIEGVFACFNASAGQRVFLGHWTSRSWAKIWGQTTSLGPIGLRHGPQSFQQLIPALYNNALNEARSWLGPRPGKEVLDLYTGVGASLRMWKEAGARALGIELLGEAVEIGGEDILQGRVSERLPQIEHWLTRPDPLVFANPPRTGMEPEVVDWLVRKARPAKIAYLSCSAGTLARDLLKLVDCAYRVERIIPYDFFPQTHHVESLALLELCDRVDPARGERFCRAE